MFKEGIAKFLKLDNLMEHLTGYVETRIEILKYDLKEDLAKGLSKAAVVLTLLIVAMFFLFFLSLAAGAEIGRHLGYFAGFAIVSGFYVVAGIIIYFKREALGKNVEEKIRELIKQTKK